MRSMKKVKTAKSKKAKKTSKPREKDAQTLPPKVDEERIRKFKDFHERMKTQILKNLSNLKKPPTP